MLHFDIFGAYAPLASNVGRVLFCAPTIRLRRVADRNKVMLTISYARLV